MTRSPLIFGTPPVSWAGTRRKMAAASSCFDACASRRRNPSSGKRARSPGWTRRSGSLGGRSRPASASAAVRTNSKMFVASGAYKITVL